MARAKKRSKKNDSVVSVDLSNVKGRVVIEPGEYQAKVVSVERDEGDKGEYLRWKFEITDGEYEGKSPKPYITSLSESSLWNLRGLLEALGVDIPDEAFDLDLEEMVDLECTIVVDEDTYEGRKQSPIVDFGPAETKKKGSKKGKKKEEEEVDEDEEEEEKSSKKNKKKDKKKKKASTLSRDEVTDMSEEELADVIEEHELEVDLSDFSTIRKMRNAVIDALEEGDLLSD